MVKHLTLQKTRYRQRREVPGLSPMEIVYYIIIKVFSRKKRSIHFFYNKKTKRKEGKSNRKDFHYFNVSIFVKSCMLTKNHILGF